MLQIEESLDGDEFRVYEVRGEERRLLVVLKSIEEVIQLLNILSKML